MISSGSPGGVLKRLNDLERKVDACLILLSKATTHDCLGSA